jgi:yeast amino acid transporter
MIFLFPVLLVGWKFIKKTQFKRAHEIDLQQDLEEIEHYTRNYVERKEENMFNRWLDKVFG